MHTNHKREDPIVEMGYEIRDLDYPTLGKVAVGFVIFGVACFLSVGVWFFIAQPKTDALLNPRKPMPEITIQSNIAVRADIQSLRQKETATLSSTGTNPDGTSHIPIDKAIDLIAKRGLPHSETLIPAISPGNQIKQNALAPGQQAPASGMSGAIGGGATP